MKGEAEGEHVDGFLPKESRSYGIEYKKEKECVPIFPGNGQRVSRNSKFPPFRFYLVVAMATVNCHGAWSVPYRMQVRLQ